MNSEEALKLYKKQQERLKWDAAFRAGGFFTGGTWWIAMSGYLLYAGHPLWWIAGIVWGLVEVILGVNARLKDRP